MDANSVQSRTKWHCFNPFDSLSRSSSSSFSSSSSILRPPHKTALRHLLDLPLVVLLLLVYALLVPLSAPVLVDVAVAGFAAASEDAGASAWATATG